MPLFGKKTQEKQAIFQWGRDLKYSVSGEGAKLFGKAPKPAEPAPPQEPKRREKQVVFQWLADLAYSRSGRGARPAGKIARAPQPEGETLPGATPAEELSSAAAAGATITTLATGATLGGDRGPEVQTPPPPPSAPKPVIDLPVGKKAEPQPVPQTLAPETLAPGDTPVVDPLPGADDTGGPIQEALEALEKSEPLSAPSPEPVLPASQPPLPLEPEPAPVEPPAPDAVETPVPKAEAEAGPVVEAEPDGEPEPKLSFFARLKKGLSRSSSALGEGIGSIFTKTKLDDDTLEELEDLLISSDLGVETATAIITKLAGNKYDKEVTAGEVRQILADEIASLLEPVAKPLELRPALKPHVVLVVGVNGTGKTTTIGKLAQRFTAEGHKVMLAAGDTFRAAAIGQLTVWAERVGIPIIAKDQGADAAGLAFEALEKAKADGVDVLLIDTAGRLQNKSGLMAELEKVQRVLKKLDPDAPHTVLLVLDATTGQNAVSQVEVFKDKAHVTGLVMTKLDGTARGGILVALASKFGLPIHAVGVGEGIEDLQPFEADAFAQALVGVGEEQDEAA